MDNFNENEKNRALEFLTKVENVGQLQLDDAPIKLLMLGQYSYYLIVNV